jgi:hypothetical protein
MLDLDPNHSGANLGLGYSLKSLGNHKGTLATTGNTPSMLRSAGFFGKGG